MNDHSGILIMTRKKKKSQRVQLKMGDLSRDSGFSVSTLYDYLRMGILQPPFKESPTKSYFNNEHLDRLLEIRNLRKKGTRLADIKNAMGHDEGNATYGAAPDAVRLEIIDKALELFSRHHYENTKISDITNALNMGNGTFYRYFKSKEELFLYCLERLPKVLVPKDAWIEVDKEPDFVQRLKKRGYAMLNAFPSYIGILNYAKLALGGVDETLAKKAAECIRSLVKPLMTDLGNAIREGKVRKVDEELCAYLLLGMNETFGYRLLIDPNYSIEEGFAVIEDFVIHALTNRDSKTDDDSLSAILIDTGGNKITINNIQFNDEPYVSGNYMEGDLLIPVSDIKEIVVAQTGGIFSFRVDLKKKDAVCLGIEKGICVSGDTPLGRFRIAVEKIRHISFN